MCYTVCSSGCSDDSHPDPGLLPLWVRVGLGVITIESLFSLELLLFVCLEGKSPRYRRKIIEIF